MPLPTYSFDDFRSDPSIFGDRGLTLAQGVLPWNGNWRELRNPASHLTVGSLSNDWTSKPSARTFWQFQESALEGTYYTVYRPPAVDRREIRIATNRSVSTNVSKGGGGYGNSGHAFRFARFGQWVIAAALDVALQVRQGAGNFDDLVSSGSAPRARFVGSCRGRAVLGNVWESGTFYDTRVWWSKRNDATVYTPGALPSDPGFLDMNDGLDHITGMAFWDDGFLVFRHQGVERWSFAAGDTTWYRRVIGTAKDGMQLGHEIAQDGRDCYYYSHSGFKAIRGLEQIESIDTGLGKFFNDSGPWAVRDKNDELRVALDPSTGCAVFAYSPLGLYPGPDLALAIYNPADDHWSVLRIDGLGSDPHMLTARTPNDLGEKFGPVFLLLGNDAGTTIDHYSFNAATSMPILMKGRRFRIAGEGQGQLSRIRPVYSFEDEESQPPLTAIPPVKLTLRRSQHPGFKAFETTVLTNAAEDQEGFFLDTESGKPLPITANWLQVDVDVPSYALDLATPLNLMELRGFEYEPAARGRGR